ncbi:MAG: PIN domain-containing protein [Acidimicrobiales bacterium]
MSLVLDTGALIAFERGDREVAALVEATRRRAERIVTSSGCIAQAWRQGGPRQALLARLLGGTNEAALDHQVSRRLGELCAAAGSNDVVDAHVALLARHDDVLVTSDPKDLGVLLRARGADVHVHAC